MPSRHRQGREVAGPSSTAGRRRAGRPSPGPFRPWRNLRTGRPARRLTVAVQVQGSVPSRSILRTSLRLSPLRKKRIRSFSCGSGLGYHLKVIKERRRHTATGNAAWMRIPSESPVTQKSGLTQFQSFFFVFQSMSIEAVSLHLEPFETCGEGNCGLCKKIREKADGDWCLEWLRHLKDIEMSQEELAEKDRQVLLIVDRTDYDVRYIRSKLAILQTQTVMI
jgi:hypothetical protein